MADRMENRSGRSLITVTLLYLLVLIRVSGSVSSQNKEDGEPKPRAWPEQFHSLTVMNLTTTAELQVVDLWYDWPNGRNLNLIQHQLGKLLYDVEWNNGTSYYFTRSGDLECRTLLFPVGILGPNWLEGATYLGQQHMDGFLCHVWDKVDFIRYYEDVVTHRPVFWLFYTGMAHHVMTFEVGAVLEDSEWQTPVHCFDKNETLAPSLQHPHQFLRDSLPLVAV